MLIFTKIRFFLFNERHMFPDRPLPKKERERERERVSKGNAILCKIQLLALNPWVRCARISMRILVPVILPKSCGKSRAGVFFLRRRITQTQ